MVISPHIRYGLRWIFTVLWSLSFLAILLSYWQTPFFLNLVSSFRFQMTLTLLGLSFPLLALWNGRLSWAFLALSLALTCSFLKYIGPTSKSVGLADAPNRSVVRLAIANVLSSNHDLGRFDRWLDAETPDIVGILEVSEAHRAQLEKLPFQHRLIHPQNGNFGLALLCKQAPLKIEVIEAETSFPSILAQWPDYNVLLTHPAPPISRRARQVGDQQIERLIQSLSDTDRPLIVLGDLNAAGWDRRLAPIREAGLVEARIGHGLLPTWPVDRAILRIPIDHIFLPLGWLSLECRRGPDVGSDHFPLICEAQPKP